MSEDPRYEAEWIREALDAFCDRGHELTCDFVEAGGRVECSCDLIRAEVAYGALLKLEADHSKVVAELGRTDAELQNVYAERDELAKEHRKSMEAFARLSPEIADLRARAEAAEKEVERLRKDAVFRSNLRAAEAERDRYRAALEEVEAIGDDVFSTSAHYRIGWQDAMRTMYRITREARAALPQDATERGDAITHRP